MKLTPKQKAFVREYKKNGGNGTQAAINAGYSEESARAISSENLTKPYIQEALKQEEKKLQEKYEYTIDDMVRELDDVKMKADAEQNRQAHFAIKYNVDRRTISDILKGKKLYIGEILCK